MATSQGKPSEPRTPRQLETSGPFACRVRYTWQAEAPALPARCPLRCPPSSPSRYARFWVLQLVHKQQQQQRGQADAEELLVPAADMALFWLAHISMSGSYRAVCRHFQPGGISPGEGDAGGAQGGYGSSGWTPGLMAGPGHLMLCGADWARAYARTKRLYEATYGEYEL